MLIYVIENKINQKKYVGKTSNFERRYREHFSDSYQKRDCNKVLYKAMKKHGKENFEMRVLEVCDEKNWEQCEQKWIIELNTLIPNGYNMIPGGSEPPHWKNEDHPGSILTWKDVNDIITLLQKYSAKELSNIDIAIRFNISVDQIKRINNGESWRKDNIIYPIRHYNSKHLLEEIYELLETWEYTCEEIGKIFGKTTSCIKAINSGQNFFDPNRIYPVKPQKIFYPKYKYYEALYYIQKGLKDSEIERITGVKKGTLINLRNGKYDKYLTCND